MEKDTIQTKCWWEKESVCPFKPCSSFMIVGATKSGKTQWVKKLLEQQSGMFVENVPEKVLYCYGVDQPAFDDMRKTIPNIEFQQGLPDEDKVEEVLSRHTVIVLDDLMSDVLVNPRIEKLFTLGCHHKNLSVIYITQNLFAQGKSPGLSV